MKALKAYNTEALTRFHKRKVHDTDVVEEPQDDPSEPSVPDSGLSELPESDLDVPEDPILAFVNSQCHDSEDLDQALQPYQAYQVPCSYDSVPSPERIINDHYTYHVAQASQAKHGSLVDRDANGGLARSDVRILSRSSRKCIAIGVNTHELQGLDVVQDSALVETNHGTVNFIMNEYACFGIGYTIHSSGQIEWFKNSVDDRSVQVGGKQSIALLMAMLFPWCAEGALCTFVSFESRQTRIWRGIQLYTSQDPMNGILLSWTFLTHLVMGSLLGPMTPLRGLLLTLTLMNWGLYHRAIQTINSLDDSSRQMTPFSTIWAYQMFLGTTNMLLTMIPLIMEISGLILVGSMLILFRKPLNCPLNGSLHSQHIFYEEAPQV